MCRSWLGLYCMEQKNKKSALILPADAFEMIRNAYWNMY